MNCPQCSSDNIHRSRHRNRFEAWRKSIFHQRLYRCHDCGWRGWLKIASDNTNTSPHYKFSTWLIIVIVAILTFWLLLPYLE